MEYADGNLTRRAVLIHLRELERKPRTIAKMEFTTFEHVVHIQPDVNLLVAWLGIEADVAHLHRDHGDGDARRRTREEVPIGNLNGGNRIRLANIVPELRVDETEREPLNINPEGLPLHDVLCRLLERAEKIRKGVARCKGEIAAGGNGIAHDPSRTKLQVDVALRGSGDR